MTDAPTFAPAEPLPGLTDPGPRDSALRVAAHRTITALDAAGYLDERHALVCQLILDLADVHDAGVRQGKASAAAMAAAQILAAYQLIMPEASTGGDGDGWDDLVADIRRGTAEARHAANLGPQE